MCESNPPFPPHFQIMLNASLVPSIVADLVAHDGLLTFMQNCVGYLTMEPENSFVLRIIKVISHLFRGWSAANSNWHGRSGVLVWFKSFSNVVADLIEKIGTNFSSTAFPFAASSLTPEHSVWRMNVLLEISKLVNLLCTSEWRQDNVLTLQHLATIIKYVQELRTVVSSEAVDVMVPAMMTTTTTTITKRGGRLNDVERDMDRAYGIICRQIFSSLTSSKAFISTGTLNFLKPLPSLSATSPSLEIVIRWCMQLIENHVLRDDSCSGVNGGVSAGLVIGSDLMLEALAPEEEWLKWMLQLQHNHSLILSCSSGVGSSVSSLPLSLWGLLLDHFLKITSVRLGASSCCALYGYYNVKCLLLNASQRLEDDTFPAAALGKRRRNNDEDKLETGELRLCFNGFIFCSIFITLSFRN